jgi:hypothetical protein
MISPLDVPPDDDELDAWLRQKPFAGKPFRDFIPPGALHAIGRMIDDPALNWPSPYTYEQLKTLLVILPQAVRDEFGRQIVPKVRVYLGKRWVQIKKPRGNPGEARRKAILAFQRAIGDLNVNVTDADDLCRRHMIDRYVHELHLSQKPPKRLDGGRPALELDRKFWATIEGIYDAAFGGARPKRGFPDFAWAIFEPLAAWGVDCPTNKDNLRQAIKDLRRPSDRRSRGTAG